MRYAIVEKGVVKNVILADPAFVEAQQLAAVLSEEAGPGWQWDGEKFIPPPPPPPPPKSPRELKREAALAAIADIKAEAGPTIPAAKLRAAFAALEELL